MAFTQRALLMRLSEAAECLARDLNGAKSEVSELQRERLALRDTVQLLQHQARGITAALDLANTDLAATRIALDAVRGEFTSVAVAAWPLLPADVRAGVPPPPPPPQASPSSRAEPATATSSSSSPASASSSPLSAGDSLFAGASTLSPSTVRAMSSREVALIIRKRAADAASLPAEAVPGLVRRPSAVAVSPSSASPTAAEPSTPQSAADRSGATEATEHELRAARVRAEALRQAQIVLQSRVRALQDDAELCDAELTRLTEEAVSRAQEVNEMHAQLRNAAAEAAEALALAEGLGAYVQRLRAGLGASSWPAPLPDPPSPQVRAPRVASGNPPESSTGSSDASPHASWEHPPPHHIADRPGPHFTGAVPNRYAPSAPQEDEEEEEDEVDDNDELDRTPGAAEAVRSSHPTPSTTMEQLAATPPPPPPVPSPGPASGSLISPPPARSALANSRQGLSREPSLRSVRWMDSPESAEASPSLQPGDSVAAGHVLEPSHDDRSPPASSALWLEVLGAGPAPARVRHLDAAAERKEDDDEEDARLDALAGSHPHSMASSSAPGLSAGRYSRVAPPPGLRFESPGSGSPAAVPASSRLPVTPGAGIALRGPAGTRLGSPVDAELSAASPANSFGSGLVSSPASVIARSSGDAATHTSTLRRSLGGESQLSTVTESSREDSLGTSSAAASHLAGQRVSAESTRSPGSAVGGHRGRAVDPIGTVRAGPSTPGGLVVGGTDGGLPSPVSVVTPPSRVAPVAPGSAMNSGALPRVSDADVAWADSLQQAARELEALLSHRGDSIGDGGRSYLTGINAIVDRLQTAAGVGGGGAPDESPMSGHHHRLP